LVKFYATKNVEIKRIVAILQVKAEYRRPDIVFMLNNLEKTGLTTGERKNYAEYLQYMGLTANGQLTTEGARAVKSGLVMVPEYGIYELMYIDDVKFERKNNNKPKIIKKPDTKATIQLTYNTEANKVDWKFTSQDYDFNIKDYTALDIYANIKKMVKNWDDENKAHIVSFNEIKDNKSKMKDFKETLQAQEFQLEYKFGKDNTTYRVAADDVDILPRTISDAREWAYELLLIGLDGGYHTIKSITDKMATIMEEKPLRKRHPELTVDWGYVEEKLKASKVPEDKNLLIMIRAAEDLTPEIEA